MVTQGNCQKLGEIVGHSKGWEIEVNARGQHVILRAKSLLPLANNFLSLGYQSEVLMLLSFVLQPTGKVSWWQIKCVTSSHLCNNTDHVKFLWDPTSPGWFELIKPTQRDLRNTYMSCLQYCATLYYTSAQLCNTHYEASGCNIMMRP